MKSFHRLASIPAKLSILVSASLLGGGCNQPAQSDTQVRHVVLTGDEVSCESCKLTLHEELVVGSVEGPGAFENASLGVRSTSKNLFVFSMFGTQVKVFSRGGEFVGQVGRPGAGPGEFRMISAIDVEGDGSLHVFDTGLGTHTKFAPNLELQSTRQLEIRPTHDVVVLPDRESLLITSSAMTPSVDGHPLHWVDPAGRLERSFGSQIEDINTPSTYNLRISALSGDTAVWVAHVNRYQIELWDIREAADAPLMTIERRVQWFPPGVEDTGSLESPPAPGVVDIQPTSDGKLMTVIRVPDARWSDAVRLRGREIEIVDPDGYFDTIVEVLDPTTRAVETATRRPEVLGPFAGAGLLSWVEVDAIGVPMLHLLRIQRE